MTCGRDCRSGLVCLWIEGGVPFVEDGGNIGDFDIAQDVFFDLCLWFVSVGFGGGVEVGERRHGLFSA